MSAQPKDVARSYLESFSSGDPNVIAAHVATSFVNEHTAALGSSCEGKAEYLRRLPGFLESLPGLDYEVEDVIGEGEQVAAAYILTAAINGRAIRVRGVMRMSVVNGLITHRVDYWDSKVFLDQAGL
jgi:ketosteroid isomerase-like protein